MFSYTGPIINLYECQKNALEKLVNHKLPTVRDWVRKYVAELESNIESERNKMEYDKLLRQ